MVGRAIGVVNAIEIISAGDCGFDGNDIIECPWIRVKQRISEAMCLPGRLIDERHQTGKDRAGQARAADAILIIVSAVREGLSFTDEQPGLGVG